MRPAARDEGGFVPIADYAVLGDGRTAALVASDGRLDWWPFPTLDSPPLCAAVVDPDRGGHLLLAPTEPYEVERRYVEGTNVLQATYTTRSGVATVTTALSSGSAGRLPWTELAARVEGERGEVPMRWELVPGDRFRQASPWVRSWHGVPVATVGDQTVAVVVGGAAPGTAEPGRAHGTLTAVPGGRVVLGVVATDAEPLFLPSPSAVDDRIDRTVASWRRWSALLDVPPPWEAAVRRSALALKTLLAEDTGAIAAAATTSLPEAVGGAKNWDYRFAWVRDTSFTLDALINLGLHEEVHGAVSWLLEAVRRNGPDLHVFYTLDGGVETAERRLDIPGYRHSQPVRDGI
ncbi:MAG: glycoside hydrolase family 15 protein, partial [Acidimicrobiales bacterium]